MSDVAVYAVVHPGVMRFFSDFWNSLQPQLGDGFEAWLSLDGVAADEVLAVTGPTASVRFVEPQAVSSAGPGSPVDIRKWALAKLTADYAAVVLLDCDDVLLPERLEAARRSLEQYDVYACALRIVDESTSPSPVPLFTLSEDEVDRLRHGALLATANPVGFGNSAFRSEVLAACLDVPTDARLMDWLVASRAHLAGASFTFDTAPRMLYRQYGNNTANILPPFTGDRILTDTRRVLDHYRALLTTPHDSVRSVAPFERAWDHVKNFHDWLEAPGHSPRRNLTEYVERLNALPMRTFLWWQHVALELPGLDFRTDPVSQEEEVHT
jgi:hypothetical protein